MLENEFGAEIAALVNACSEPDKSLPWRERKQHTIDALAAAAWQVKAVVAADKLDNLHAMSADFSLVGDALWTRFNQGRAQQEWYYRGIAQALSIPGPGEPDGLSRLRKDMNDMVNLSFPKNP